MLEQQWMVDAMTESAVRTAMAVMDVAGGMAVVNTILGRGFRVARIADRGPSDPCRHRCAPTVLDVVQTLTLERCRLQSGAPVRDGEGIVQETIN
jgi:hypothetical protein